MRGQVGMRLRVLYPFRGERMSPSINQQSAKQLRPSSKLFDSYHDVLWGAVSMSGGALSCALQCQQLPTLQLVPARRSTRTSNRLRTAHNSHKELSAAVTQAYS
jgi:hypothetical protein